MSKLNSSQIHPVNKIATSKLQMLKNAILEGKRVIVSLNNGMRYSVSDIKLNPLDEIIFTIQPFPANWLRASRYRISIDNFQIETGKLVK
jgi:hypothetical protein